MRSLQLVSALYSAKLCRTCTCAVPCACSGSSSLLAGSALRHKLPSCAASMFGALGGLLCGLTMQCMSDGSLLLVSARGCAAVTSNALQASTGCAHRLRTWDFASLQALIRAGPVTWSKAASCRLMAPSVNYLHCVNFLHPVSSAQHLWSAGCRHTEDLDLHSVNFLHYGAPKVWYCIAPEDRLKFERAAANAPELQALFRDCPQFFRHKVSVPVAGLVASPKKTCH